MKKISKQLFAAAVALAALTACSDSNFSEVDPSVPAPEYGEQANNTSVLTDASGQQVSTVSSQMGTYYLNIKTDGAWYIEGSNNMEFTPTRMYGMGSARVPVIIGNNWADARQLSFKVNYINKDSKTRSMRRAGEGNSDPQTVTQEASADVDGFKKLINSNIFVGYGYYSNKNTVPELCTGQQIFKMSSTDPNVINSISPQAKEEYFYAHSEEVLDKVVNVNGHPGGNFGAVKMSLDLDNADVTRQSSFSITIMQKSLTRSLYSREINFADMQANQDNFTDGFKAYKEAFITKFNAASTDAEKEEVAKDFFLVYGSHFVTKAFFGCELHYRMAVAATKAKKATDVKAALDFKWKQQVKDTAKVDSAQLDSLKKLLPDSVRKNFVFHGGVMVKDSTFSAASSTQAQLNARGNDVKKVSILTTGGELKCDDLAAWMLGAKPEEAVMTGFEVLPIYFLFNGTSDAEQKAYKDLKKLIDKSYKLAPAQDGFGKLKDE